MAYSSIGTQLLIGANAVAELSSIKGLELSADTIETTALDTIGGYRTYIGGFRDAGDVSIAGFFNPNDTQGQVALYNAFQNGTVLSMAIKFPSSLGTSWIFNAVVTKYATSVETGNAISFEATVKISGQPTLATTITDDLTGLTLVGATLSPTFVGNKYYYTATATGNVTITPTLTSANIDIFINDVKFGTVASGSTSSAITLNVGDVKEIVLYVTIPGKTTKTYTIMVTR